MSGNGTAVGKRLGVAPTLARRMPAAGRNGKRLLTGEQKNLNAIVGKGAVADAVSRLAKPGRLAARRAAKRPTNFDYGTSSFSSSELSLPRTHPYLPGDSIRGKTPAKAPNPGPRSFETPGTTAERVHYRPSRLQGRVNKGFLRPTKAAMSITKIPTFGEKLPTAPAAPLKGRAARKAKQVREDTIASLPKAPSWTSMAKAAAGTNGMGQLVPQFRGAALKSLTPQAPSFAPKQQKQGNTLVAAGGSKPSTAGLSGVAGSSSAGSASSGGGGGLAGGVGKRSYDPEDERRHRQGALAATAGLGGADLVYSGAKETARETRLQRGAPKLFKPGMPPTRDTGPWRDAKGKLRQASAQERQGEDMAYDLRRARHAARVDAYRRLAHPKGVQVTARAGGKLGAGLALIGGGVALHRKRTEPRYD